MCTIMTFTKDMLNDKIYSRIIDDMKWNSDGFALILTDKYGELITCLRTMNEDAIISTLTAVDFRRAFLHCRMATQGAPKLENVHGWYGGGFYVMHNGILSDPEAKRYAVDSQMIMQKLKNSGMGRTLKWLRTQAYQNCLLLDSKTNSYYVTRSTSGSLYTDGIGNFSTNRVGDIDKEVVRDTYQQYQFERVVRPPVNVYGFQRYDDNFTDHRIHGTYFSGTDSFKDGDDYLYERINGKGPLKVVVINGKPVLSNKA